MNKFTPTEQRIIDLLSDGLPHSKEEIRLCLLDSEADVNTIKVHICHIRPKIRGIGQDIICELAYRQIFYRHVILLGNPYSGYN